MTRMNADLIRVYPRHPRLFMFQLAIDSQPHLNGSRLAFTEVGGI
jgi:hypothetical protein